ncbi:box C/D snoRNA protein 1 [Neodiprion pinetum]|uniref:Box C/D snoRNA protein 1 n=1 Tax=Neodiprion lecontei TaxID=441921 RepID=A0A6J0BUU2_NEOLC|nr:box C/D snoRNA protein 1 [Neodiprion lecontei]XP_046474186.1 box C/D snoRNA protein 1 [Neodiprion pinetum]
MATCSVKLEECEVCGGRSAKYTCPKCEVRTCCLDCVKIHKKELDCDGIRDKTKFVPLKAFTDLDVLSDYRLLEEVGRSVDSFQRDPSKKYTRLGNLPVHLHKLKTAVHHRNTKLEFLPQNFSRHKINTTYYKWKTNELFWRIEWIFPQAENMKHNDNRVLETERLSTILGRVLDPLTIETEGSESIEVINLKIAYREKLQYYRAAGFSNIKVLLKAEKVKRCDSRFHELNLTETLNENLENKTIIEFPVFYVILKDHSDMYEIVDTDEEEASTEAEQTRGNLKRKHTNNQRVKKKNEGVPVNFFFDNDLTDSENESMEMVSKNKMYSNL